jgi:hypothetical protein
MNFTVIDRETRQEVETSLSASEVVDRYVAEGKRSAALSLLRSVKVGECLTLGAIIAQRTTSVPR